MKWRSFAWLLIFFMPMERVLAVPDLRFDVVTLCCNCTGSLLCQSQFDHLNFPTVNGHYLAMGSDTNRGQLLANGNLLAIYYNSFTADWNTNTSAAQEAAVIDQYSTSLFTTTGPRPNWIVLNEISGSTWPANQTYRTWVENVVHLLHNTYGYTVILFAPFANPANNSADWQAIAGDAYIAVENYLSGQQIQAQNFSISWCQGIYQSSLGSYGALGVPASQLILGEHFGQTVTNTDYGRSGVSSNDWDNAINARSQAAFNCSYTGFIGYDWGGDPLGVDGNEMQHYEDTYAARLLPSSGALTLPYPAQQPQNETVPAGGMVSFTVYPAGDAAISYQWKFNGALLPGSTNSTLVLTNISPANAGSYAVLLSNAVGSAWSSNAVLTVAIPPPLAFEPFAETVGSNLIGQTNGQGLNWYQAGPASALTNQPIIQSNNLVIPGLAFPLGNSVQFGGGGGMAARFQLSTNPGTASGTIYYSFAVKLTNINNLSSSGVFWAGFNNSTGAQPGTPSVVAARVYTRAAAGGFNFGLSKSSSAASDWQWDGAVHMTNEAVFLVGSYTFNSGSTNDDVANLWGNPAANTFGLAAAPSATLMAGSGPDISSAVIASFLLMNRDALEPAGGVVDELRIGLSWASVTPPAGPAPALAIAQETGAIILSWPAAAAGFSLHYSPSLSTTSSWPSVPASVYLFNGQCTVTNGLPVGTEYFRLQLP